VQSPLQAGGPFLNRVNELKNGLSGMKKPTPWPDLASGAGRESVIGQLID
jgi:hypothetical protein